MPAVFDIEVITPDRTVFAGPAIGIIAPGAEGYLGVLAHHAPLLTSLRVGEARVTDAEGRDTWFAVSGGFLEVGANRAVLLADAAEAAQQIDVARAEAARARAERARARHPRTDPSFAAAEAALARALNRLRVAREHGRATG
jgi:F-type H+-transporting ATPase subunit epsilon